MTTTMTTPDNAPRDLAGLMALSRAIRFRLAINMGIVVAGTNEANAFVSSTPEVQSKTLLDALLVRDGAGGQPQQQQLPPQQQMPAPMQPTGSVMPQQMMPPQMGGAGMAPPPQMAPAAAPASRQPSTQADPANAGGAAGAAPAANAAVIKAVQELKAELKGIKAELETCAGAGDLEELSEVVKGLTRVTRMILVLQLELAEASLGMDKPTLMGMVAVMSNGDELDVLLKGIEGKG